MAIQLVVRNNKVLAHGEDCFIPMGSTVLNKLTGNNYQNATIVTTCTASLPGDIDCNSYEYHAGEFICDGNDHTSTIYTVTFETSDWEVTGDATYRCMKSVEGILATDNPIVDVDLSSDVTAARTQLISYSYLLDGDIVTSDNGITAYCFTTKPSVALTIILMVVR